MNLIKFSQMLCSRLCHDLITPIGAINTSLELLEESDPEDRLQLLELAKQSAEKAIRKLVFCRAAFGYSSDSHLSTIDQAKKLLQDFLMLNKIELLWEKEIQQSSEISSTFSQYAQVIANLSFICAEIAPYGGQLLIEFIKPQIIRLHLKGKLVPLRPIILSSLTGELSEDEMSSHVIQAIYTRMLCEKLYLALEINHQERVSLEFILRGND
ncbi:MAG: hypothetical protein J0H12_05750 [Candidatus Paracaedimonas acanthamoebae]|uniref:Histidine phosphotransferase ChpT C-terminal domain-containing protein n=1 Tax=Candidatus Paracaedimonas acanthamoebae TaxID=244581 RepID=A0A8J7PMQ2_9PROT|nr:hypothetical protein [Candidatus Paracaedimonas acanthamoebae]